ncbi:MAG: hypothetical protein HY554_05080 [Elusimicrobia bacterium]|nr:hypothetical protein [Elusimicrobiota bacterium]
MRAWPAALLLCAAGCAAELVERRPRRPGPVPEVVLDAGGGHVRYSLKGPELLVRRRKRDAWEKMALQCGGPDRFRVVDEVAREEAEASYTGEELDEPLKATDRHYAVATRQHVYFECVK